MVGGLKIVKLKYVLNYCIVHFFSFFLEHFAPQLSPNYANNTNSSRVADFSRSLGRSGGAEFLRHNQHQHQHQQFQQNNNNNNYNYFGSMGRSSGAMMAPRTPMMGRQIKARRYSQLPPRPKSR